ncbi:MAG: hypothetical protein ABL959_18675, partial [Pyrinomonadaceae bacterium]
PGAMGATTADGATEMVTATVAGATDEAAVAVTVYQVGGPSKIESKFVTGKEAVRKGGLSYICNS